jgi:hypothetical protein
MARAVWVAGLVLLGGGITRMRRPCRPLLEQLDRPKAMGENGLQRTNLSSRTTAGLQVFAPRHRRGGG